jgi:hypothetical protein
MNHLRFLATEKKNPLYLWEAICMCLAEREPLPRWASDYVRDVAALLWNLAEQCAGREGTLFHDLEHQGQPPLAALTPPEALKLVPQLLELTREKWNAFAGYVSDQKHMRDAGTEQWFNVAPEWAKQRMKPPIETIGDRRELLGKDIASVQRSVRRRVAQGKKLRDGYFRTPLPK